MKKKKFSVAKEILIEIFENSLAATGFFTDAFFEYPHMAKGNYQDSDLKYVKKEISRLKREKFVEERKRGDRLELVLTSKGKRAARKYHVLTCKEKVKDKYYLVIFDIPESERKTRDFFRAFLKEAEFIQLQQSVWVTKKEILEPLKEIIKDAGAEKWIHIVTATDISDFSLK
ncbi:MAG: CRISPR-associated endonuclease Cas2 [Patescibacteria group bacterium]|nr:CRISPR-associated endonuclease Cas2 [Patescibacteria group bacterium]